MPRATHRLGLTLRLAMIGLAALIGLSFAGCVSLQSVADHGWEDARSIQRGQALAAAQCAACHDAGPGPSFASIAERYHRDSLVREFQVISEVGHYGMASRLIAVGERADLASYIDHLARP